MNSATVALSAAVAVVGSMASGSMAWADLNPVGTFTVCQPASKTYVSAKCARITGLTQSGSVGGAGGLSSGEVFSAKAANLHSKRYTVTFRDAGSTADCHRPLTNPSTHTLADFATGATSFMGPTFYKTFVVPPQITTGAAEICVQDTDLVSGHHISVAVV